jgi:hypothetical protein
MIFYSFSANTSKLMLYLFACLLSLLSPLTASAEPQTLSIPDLGFSITYPSETFQDQGSILGSSRVRLSSRRADSKSAVPYKFPIVTIDVVKGELPEEINKSLYYDHRVITQLKFLTMNYAKLISPSIVGTSSLSSSNLKISIPTVTFRHSYPAVGKVPAVGMQSSISIIKTSGRYYAIIYEDLEENFDKNIELRNFILGSFTITSEAPPSLKAPQRAPDVTGASRFFSDPVSLLINVSALVLFLLYLGYKFLLPMVATNRRPKKRQSQF